MNEQDPSGDSPAPRRPWQLRLIHLLLVAVALALALGFVAGWYPYSVRSIPLALLAVPGVLVVFLVVHGFRWQRVRPSEVIASSILIYIVITVFQPAGLDGPEVGRRPQCTNNLKQILLALQNYHEVYGSFPPAYVADASGRPMHSWRVLILPFMEEKGLYNRYHFDEPWNGPNNSLLATQHVLAYECPSQKKRTPGMTNYVAVVGPETAWPGAASMKLGGISDGAANTLLVVEVADSDIPWMEPHDMDFATMSFSVDPKTGRGISSHHCTDAWRPEHLGANAACADGSVRFLPSDTPPSRVRALLTAGGAEATEEEFGPR